MSDFISVVVPIYRCGSHMGELARRINKSFDEINCTGEIIFVDDGCPEKPWQDIVNLSDEITNVKGLSLSRNVGQHIAITAGLDVAKGDYIVVMDGDLQDRPEEIVPLYKKILEGFNVVFAKREDRKDSILKKITSKVFYSLFNWLVGAQLDHQVANFGIYSQKVIEEYRRMTEKARCFPFAINWLGFKTSTISVTHVKRKSGEKSSYSLKDRIRLGLTTIIFHSNRPLYLSVFMGVSMSFVSFLFGTFFFMRAFLGGVRAVLGWSSLIVSIYFLSGVILTSVGLLGIYIGNIYNEVKSRPLYSIEERTEK